MTHRARKKRSTNIDEGVEGTEISLYVKRVREPNIRVLFLHRNRNIYRNTIRILVNEKDLKDFDLLNYCNMLRYQLVEMGAKRIVEVYQAVADIIGHNVIKEFDTRHLRLDPYFQVTSVPRGFIKYNEKAKREYFQKPLFKKSKGI